MDSKKTRAWLKENLGKECMAPLTSTDGLALDAAVAMLELFAYDRNELVLQAFGAVVLRMQKSTRRLAYHAIAMVMDWEDRPKLWQRAGLEESGIEFGRCKHEWTAGAI